MQRAVRVEQIKMFYSGLSSYLVLTVAKAKPLKQGGKP
jgi:hypothetical protein